MSLDERLRRLDDERVAADRRYNEALTRLGHAQLTDVPTLPVPPAGNDLHASSTRSLIDAVRRRYEDTIRFQHQLILFLQQITGMVEARERQKGAEQLRTDVVQAHAKLAELSRDIRALRDDGAPATSRGVATVDSVESRPAAASEAAALGHRRARREHAGRNVIDGRAMSRNEAAAFLESQPDGSLDRLAVLSLVEYLEPPALSRFLDLARAKLASGAEIVIETINPACWQSFFECYNTDLRHARPLHPETLEWLIAHTGFLDVRLQFRNPIPEADKLLRVSKTLAEDPEFAVLAAAIDQHADRLNSQLFGFLDYEITARR